MLLNTIVIFQIIFQKKGNDANCIVSTLSLQRFES